MADLLERLRSALADRYAIESEIGRGGMAVVFLAEDLKHHRKVAIKVTHPEISSDVATERFFREIEIVAGLTHPHILPLHDSGQADGLLYCVVPFIEGASLLDRLLREKQLPVEDAVQVTREVAEALAYAHGRGIIHRDIKPANILLQHGRALVADFGIARAIEQACGKRITQTGVAVGTPAYMSPEQASGVKNLDARTDVYALGCVLYEMLAGQPPLMGATPQATLARRMAERPPPLHTVRSSVPEAVDRIMARALDPVPADRYATASEFASAIAVATKAEAVQLRRPAVRQPFGRPVRRTGALVAGILIVAIAAWRLLPHLVGPVSEPRSGTGLEVGRSIAVLPFANLSGEPETEPFVSGIHEDILIHLYKIAGLRPISRTSVMEYRDTKTNLKEIGDALGVAAVLEGSVQRVGNTVRIAVQLIDVETDEHIWAEVYDRDLTAESVFSIQTEISTQIASALRAQLSVEEVERIAYQPTRNLEAYDVYLAAREYERRWRASEEDRRIAVQQYEKAIELEPEFALAYADLSEFQSRVCYIYGCPAEVLARTKDLAETSLTLEPDLASARVALGNYYYYALSEHERSVEEYLRAIELEPNNSDAHGRLAAVRARMGNLTEAVASARMAVELSPRDSDAHDMLGHIYSWLREYRAAIQSYDRSIALAPDVSFPRFWKTWAILNLVGGGDRAIETWTRGVEALDSQMLPFSAIFYGRTLSRVLGPQIPVGRLPGDDPLAEASYLLSRATVDEAAGDIRSARAWYDSARAFLDERPAGVAPEYRSSALGVIYAKLGRTNEAIREATMAVELLPVSADAFEGPWFVAALAEVYVMVGDYEAALDQLETLLSIPCPVSPPLLEADPVWRPLRDQPRYRALVGQER